MLRQQALNQCNGLCQDGDITFTDSFDIFIRGERVAFATLKIGVDNRWLWYTFIDFQGTVVVLVVVYLFVVFHGKRLFCGCLPVADWVSPLYCPGKFCLTKCAPDKGASLHEISNSGK